MGSKIGHLIQQFARYLFDDGKSPVESYTSLNPDSSSGNAAANTGEIPRGTSMSEIAELHRERIQRYLDLLGDPPTRRIAGEYSPKPCCESHGAALRIR